MLIADAVMGALIALSGVLLTQISVHIGDWIKSAREQGQAQQQRELSLKRDIYLPLVHAFTEGINLFIAIPQADHSQLAELKLSQTAQNALAAKDLIASDCVMSAVNSAAKQLAQGTMRLMALKMDEAKLAIDLDYLSKRINELNTGSRLINDRMRVILETETLQPDEATALNSQFKHNQSELQGLFTEQQEKFENRNALLKELQMQMVKEICELTAVLAHAVIEIRRDLNIPTNADAIISHYKESIRFREESLPGIIDETWRKVNNNAET